MVSWTRVQRSKSEEAIFCPYQLPAEALGRDPVEKRCIFCSIVQGYLAVVSTAIPRGGVQLTQAPFRILVRGPVRVDGSKQSSANLLLHSVRVYASPSVMERPAYESLKLRGS